MNLMAHMSTQRHIRFGVVVLSALTLVFSGLASAEDKGEGASAATYHSSVAEVRVTFFATDENNHPLENVSMGDIAIVDSEQVIRNFRSLARCDGTSLNVVALVDISESAASHFRVEMNEVLRLVAREQSIASDSIAVLSFGGTLAGADRDGQGGTERGWSSDLRPVVFCSARCSADEIARLLARGLKSSGTTPLFDALIFASDFIAQQGRAGARPVVILFSDGDDTISLHSRGEALQAVRDAGALVYAVDIGAAKSQGLAPGSYYTSGYASGSAFMRQVSEVSGGRYLYIPQGASQADSGASVLNAVLDDLRATYVVTYDLPSRHPGFHSLRVLPTHKLNLKFHSRDGYDYEPNEQ